MNQDTTKRRPGVGRMILASGLGLIASLLSPIAFSFYPLLLVIFYRWAGKIPALITAFFMLVIGALEYGILFSGIVLLTALLPVGLLLWGQDKPFFVQMRMATAAFAGGTLLIVAYLSLRLGGNLIERFMQALVSLAREIPAENIDLALKLAPIPAEAADLFPVIQSSADFFLLLEQLAERLTPILQLLLPGALLCTALLNGVVCTYLSNRMRMKRGQAKEGSFVPISEWAVPGSATLGLTLMLIVCFMLSKANWEPGLTAFQTVLNLMVCIYCIQAIASVMRRGIAAKRSPGKRRLFAILVLVVSLIGGSMYIACYGYLSALFGSKGALAKRMHEKNKS